METVRRSEKFRGLHIRVRFFEILLTVLLVCILVMLIFWVWLIPVKIAGTSMEPTLQNGQIVLLDRLGKYVKRPERGDIIAFPSPLNGSTLLKRIVALPGEEVTIDSGKTYINGCPLDEDAYLADAEYHGTLETYTVSEDEVYVLSDNRDDIYDSRYDSVGCVSYKDITGVLRFRVFPSDRLAYFD